MVEQVLVICCPGPNLKEDIKFLRSTEINLSSFWSLNSCASLATEINFEKFLIQDRFFFDNRVSEDFRARSDLFWDLINVVTYSASCVVPYKWLGAARNKLRNTNISVEVFKVRDSLASKLTMLLSKLGIAPLHLNYKTLNGFPNILISSLYQAITFSNYSTIIVAGASFNSFSGYVNRLGFLQDEKPNYFTPNYPIKAIYKNKICGKTVTMTDILRKVSAQVSVIDEMVAHTQYVGKNLFFCSKGSILNHNVVDY
jgi:hypothetical protein